MKEHEGEEGLLPEETNGEDAITDEFNRFLEKRVEAVKREQYILCKVYNIFISAITKPYPT